MWSGKAEMFEAASRKRPVPSSRLRVHIRLKPKCSKDDQHKTSEIPLLAGAPADPLGPCDLGLTKAFLRDKMLSWSLCRFRIAPVRLLFDGS